MPVTRKICQVLVLISSVVNLSPSIALFDASGVAARPSSSREAEKVLSCWNRGSWHQWQWTPAQDPGCDAANKDASGQVDTKWLQGERLAILGDSQAVHYRRALLRHLEGCRNVRTAVRCRESSTCELRSLLPSAHQNSMHILRHPGGGGAPSCSLRTTDMALLDALAFVHHHGRYFSVAGTTESCMACGGCESIRAQCALASVESIGIEHPLDTRITSAAFNSTQEVIIRGYLAPHPPTLLAFNAGLHCAAGDPDNPLRQLVRNPGETDASWVERRAAASKRSMEETDTVGWYRTSLERYVALLRQHLPETTLVWLRTTAPGDNKPHPFIGVTNKKTLGNLNRVADAVMESNGIAVLDTWAMSSYPGLALHTDPVHLHGRNDLFYNTVMRALLSYAREVRQQQQQQQPSVQQQQPSTQQQQQPSVQQQQPSAQQQQQPSLQQQQPSAQQQQPSTQQQQQPSVQQQQPSAQQQQPSIQQQQPSIQQQQQPSLQQQQPSAQQQQPSIQQQQQLSLQQQRPTSQEQLLARQNFIQNKQKLMAKQGAVHRSRSISMSSQRHKRRPGKKGRNKGL